MSKVQAAQNKGAKATQQAFTKSEKQEDVRTSNIAAAKGS